MKRHFRFFAILFAALLGIWGVWRAGLSFEGHKANVSPAVSGQEFRAWEWPVLTPDKQDLDPKRLAELVDLIRAGERFPRLHCLLITRHGYLADRFLFKPLGIEKKFWLRNLEGQTHAGGGLALAARDTAKFGLLYLKNGRWGNEQVVPEEWVRESLRMHVDLTVKGQPPSGYGYLWWILAPDPRGNGQQYVYAARGRYAQFIFIVPEHDMVVVVNGDAKSAADQNKPIEFLYDHILTAVRR